MGEQPQSNLVWVDRQGVTKPLKKISQRARFPRLSLDGSRVLLGLGTYLAREGWTLDIARGVLSPLARKEMSHVIWTPDGSEVTGKSNQQSAIYQGPADRQWRGAETADPWWRPRSLSH